MEKMDSENFDLAGFAIVKDILSAYECDSIAQHFPGDAPLAATRQLLTQQWCATLAVQLSSHPALSSFLPASYVPVQCTYCEKSADHNWLVPVHQDLSVPVAERVDDPLLRGWSEKEGTVFVQAPVGLLEQLVAVRIHLDDCTDDDGPLRVIPGTHCHGIIPAQAAAEARQTTPNVLCSAPRGSALVMRPLLLHASSKSSGTSRRRVLHFLFAPPQPPHGLRWQETSTIRNARR